MAYRKLRDILHHQKLLHVTPDATVLAAVEQMEAHNVAAVLVIADGELCGIFTERDLLRRVVARRREPAETPISEAMSSEVVSVDGDKLGFEAVRLMHERRVRHIAVTGLGGVGFGIVSIRDFPPEELTVFEREIEFEERLWNRV